MIKDGEVSVGSQSFTCNPGPPIAQGDVSTPPEMFATGEHAIVLAEGGMCRTVPSDPQECCPVWRERNRHADTTPPDQDPTGEAMGGVHRDDRDRGRGAPRDRHDGRLRQQHDLCGRHCRRYPGVRARPLG